METQEVVVQLRKIFADFRTARDRIVELERKLQQMRQENATLRKIPIPAPKRIEQFKATNAALQEENESLREAEKIKRERIDRDFNAVARIEEFESVNSTLATQISLQDSVKLKEERMDLDSKAVRKTIRLNAVEAERYAKRLSVSNALSE